MSVRFETERPTPRIKQPEDMTEEEILASFLEEVNLLRKAALFFRSNLQRKPPAGAREKIITEVEKRRHTPGC